MSVLPKSMRSIEMALLIAAADAEGTDEGEGIVPVASTALTINPRAPFPMKPEWYLTVVAARYIRVEMLDVNVDALNTRLNTEHET